jgi:hypothetical protein
MVTQNDGQNYYLAEQHEKEYQIIPKTYTSSENQERRIELITTYISRITRQ